MVAPEPAEHLAGLEDTRRLAVALVLGRTHRPQVLAAAQRRRAIAHRDAIHVLLALWKHAQHPGRPAVAAGHLIADGELADRPPAIERHHARGERLRATPHEG